MPSMTITEAFFEDLIDDPSALDVVDMRLLEDMSDMLWLYRMERLEEIQELDLN